MFACQTRFTRILKFADSNEFHVRSPSGLSRRNPDWVATKDISCGSLALRGACPHGSNDCERDSHSLRGDKPHGDKKYHERLM